MTDKCCKTNSDSCSLMNKYQQQHCSFSVLWLSIWTDASVSHPTGVHNPVGAASCSKVSCDTDTSNIARTTQECNSDTPQTARSVKRLCTTDISQTLKCSGVTNKVIVLPQEEEINWLKVGCVVKLVMNLERMSCWTEQHLDCQKKFCLGQLVYFPSVCLVGYKIRRKNEQIWCHT